MDRFLSVRWRLAGSFLLVILILLSVTAAYLLDWTRVSYTSSASEHLRQECATLIELLPQEPDKIPDFVSGARRGLGNRITILRCDGTVVADSDAGSDHTSVFSNRPEFREALANGRGISISKSHRIETLSVAVAYGPARQPHGVILISEPMTGLGEDLAIVRRILLLAGLIGVVSAVVLGLRLAFSVVGPIECVSSAARRLERGDMNARVPVQSKAAGELGTLAYTFNAMARELQGKIDEMRRESARLKAVFDHTDNGLVLVDADNRVRMINPAACQIIGIESPSALERTLIEGTLNHDLAGLVDRARRTEEPAALDLDLAGRDKRFVHAYVAPVPRPDVGMDVLVVLHDVTALRNLDTVRRDFVANVSHELRTPIASIKAMAETILLRHGTNPAVVPQFAESIVQEADRMTLLAEDLLDLTKIESHGPETVMEPVRLSALATEVLDRLSDAAGRKSVSLSCDVDEADVIEADANYLSQVLSNLVDNAIKYTQEGGAIRVWSEQFPTFAAIRVRDNGIGIPADDLPRIFERFYRVDKDRSRQSGGTGLGLAIVKHLCEQMGGSVSVKSEVGAGSTFSVILPIRHAQESPNGHK